MKRKEKELIAEIKLKLDLELKESLDLSKVKESKDYPGKAIDDLYGPYLDIEEALKGNYIFKYRDGSIYNFKKGK